MSRHLRVLREADMVTVTTTGRHVWYQSRLEPLAELSERATQLVARAGDAPGRSPKERP